MPALACDCHAHIFSGSAEALLITPRTYTPSPAPLVSYRKMLDTLGIARGVIVQPSVYGTDNSVTLAAVAEAGEAFRAVVVVDDSVTLSELKALHHKGARGARVNLLFASDTRVDDLSGLSHKLADMDWHLQLLVNLADIPDIEALVRQLPVPVVFDHLGHVPAPEGIRSEGFQALLYLLSDEKAWVKLSGAYRLTDSHDVAYPDVAPLARALVAANPEHLVWGSDWPHPHITGPMPNDGDLIDLLADWVSDDGQRNRILVANPARLYGFST
ncbi:amidohydrolase family protein [Rhodosalinus sp. K401]|uniref:amidohydrolase family protein n=1 Tax=Rhodosalinus sp. K401 TaxID=3239195 RepID=UPI003524A204